MKKINSKGFTLIELLAVITIMGILMMVAIPAISRTIENSRRDTFASISHEYLDAVRNAVLADNIECLQSADSTEKVVASATVDGVYYFPIDTSTQGTKDLMEKGGKSPFGNAEMKGYVKWIKSSKGNGSVTTKYYAYLTDSGLHGMNDEWEENQVKRANIKTKVDSAAPTIPTKATGNLYYCKVS